MSELLSELQLYRLTPAGIRVSIRANSDREANALEPNALARQMIDLISDKKGEDILLLDTRAVSVISDFFVIATADNERQMKAIADDIQRQLKKERILPLGVEGTADSGWILLDYNGVLVHLFNRATRDYYRLEKLWENAPVVVRMQ